MNPAFKRALDKSTLEDKQSLYKTLQEPNDQDPEEVKLMLAEVKRSIDDHIRS